MHFCNGLPQSARPKSPFRRISHNSLSLSGFSVLNWRVLTPCFLWEPRLKNENRVSSSPSPRLDAASTLFPSHIDLADGQFAKANGLTADEAFELACWLRESGYASVDIVYDEADMCSVLWRK